MPEYDYHVMIENTGTGINTKVTGTLTCTFSEYDIKADCPIIPKEKSLLLKFNPLIILGDLSLKQKDSG